MFWSIPIDLTGQKNKRKLAKLKNMQSFQMVFNRLANDALRRYDIEGLPETINKRVVLQSLLWHSNVCFFEKGGSLFALPAAPSGEYNVYGDPGTAEVYSLNGAFNEPVNLYIHGSDENAFIAKTEGMRYGKSRGVMVWENEQRYPFINTVMYYAFAISDAMRTLDVIKQNLKQPNVIIAEEAVVPTVKQYLKDREDNVDSVISSGVFDPKKVSIIPFDVNGTNLNDVIALLEWYENKYREACGVENNAQIDKKGENIIQAEISVNDEYTNSNVDKCTEVLQRDLDDVNKIFGIKAKAVEVKKDDDISGSDTERTDNVSGDSGRSTSDDNI